LVWYLPSLSDTSAADADDERSFFDLLPSGWLWGTLQLFIAAALAALWRARRLGPLVPEKLPVAIRASETVEGRARLYRKANARDRAAAALRSTTRTRLAPLVGVPVSQAHAPEALLPALSAHLHNHGDGQTLHTLLFGPPPSDDTALIALADQLDALEREVRRP
jgi:FAD/FMN-containing dehydrogenase